MRVDELGNERKKEDRNFWIQDAVQEPLSVDGPIASSRLRLDFGVWLAEDELDPKIGEVESAKEFDGRERRLRRFQDRGYSNGREKRVNGMPRRDRESGYNARLSPLPDAATEDVESVWARAYGQNDGSDPEFEQFRRLDEHRFNFIC